MVDMNTYFQDIFYPSTSDYGTLDAPTGVQKLPLVAIAPHGAWDYVLELLKKLFSRLQVLKPRTVVILSSPHQNPLENGVLCPSAKIVEGYDWKLSLASLKGCTVDDSAFMEEAAFEELYPFIARLFGDADLYCLLSKGPSAELRKALENLKKEDPQALIIISTNLNGQAPEDLARSQRHELLKSLEQGYSKLDPKAVSPCALGWLNEFPGSYEILASDDQLVGHAVAIRRSND